MKDEAREIIERLYEGYREQCKIGDNITAHFLAYRLDGAIEMYEEVFGEKVIRGGEQVRYKEKGV